MSVRALGPLSWVSRSEVRLLAQGLRFMGQDSDSKDFPTKIFLKSRGTGSEKGASRHKFGKLVDSRVGSKGVDEKPS